jgi:phospholipid/cholesterol/gamma-HCH transport system substrate-binding protein
MRNVKLNYLIVGSFMIVVIAGLVIAVALLTGRTGATQKYSARLGNLRVLYLGTGFLFYGYRVGIIERMVPV